jgi:hypothetical protein
MKKNPLFKAETTLKFRFSTQSIIAQKNKKPGLKIVAKRQEDTEIHSIPIITLLQNPYYNNN